VPATIAGGATEDLVIDFTPTHGGGTYTATLTINSDDPNRPAYEVELTVEVHDPSISTDAALDFGSLTGPGTDTQPIYIDNLGATEDLTLSNPQITGAGAAAYSLGALPGPIGPGGFAEIQVTFDLGSVGTFPAQLTFDTNDPFNPTVTVDLVGEVTEVLGAISITSVTRPAANRMRIEFTGAPDTVHEIHSSTDLASSPFTGPVNVTDDGLTTDGTGAGYVEFSIDTAAEVRMFYQIQAP